MNAIYGASGTMPSTFPTLPHLFLARTLQGGVINPISQMRHTKITRLNPFPEVSDAINDAASFTKGSLSESPLSRCYTDCKSNTFFDTNPMSIEGM